MFKKVLEAEPGTRVVEAGTSEEALQLVWWQKFDLVISDINHPQMNGLELLKVLKQEQPDLRVMIVSGALNGTRWQQALRLGACCGLTKPFRGSTLRGTVAVALKG
jgi:DNA-binding NtrC family response regulator